MCYIKGKNILKINWKTDNKNTYKPAGKKGHDIGTDSCKHKWPMKTKEWVFNLFISKEKVNKIKNNVVFYTH